MTPRGTPGVDRAAAVRQAMRDLVAERGFHGASMGAVAKLAGVATGTAYTYYDSKGELVLAAYLEAKQALGDAAVIRIRPGAAADERFVQLWLGVHAHLAEDPARARFLVQVDASPYAQEAHRRAMEVQGDPLLSEATRPELADRLLALPFELLYDLGIGPVVRIVAAGTQLDDAGLRLVASACWRAITTPR